MQVWKISFGICLTMSATSIVMSQWPQMGCGLEDLCQWRMTNRIHFHSIGEHFVSHMGILMKLVGQRSFKSDFSHTCSLCTQLAVVWCKCISCAMNFMWFLVSWPVKFLLFYLYLNYVWYVVCQFDTKEFYQGVDIHTKTHTGQLLKAAQIL